MSYNGQVDFGLIGDYDAMADLDSFGLDLEAATAEDDRHRHRGAGGGQGLRRPKPRLQDAPPRASLERLADQPPRLRTAPSVK